MAQKVISIGSTANDGTGDPLRTSFDKINQNFSELYARDANITSTTVSASNGTLTGSLSIISTVGDPQILFKRPDSTLAGVVRFENTNSVVRIDARNSSAVIQNYLELSSTTPGVFKLNGSQVITAGNLDTDAALTANSDTKVASQKAIKSYVDGRITTLASQQNGFSQFKRKADAGKSANLLIWSDSTGNCRDNTGRWPQKFATSLAAKYPTHTVNLINWNTSSTIAYDAPMVISTGSTSAVLNVYNFAVSGSVPHYGMGSSWITAIASVDPDGLIINHGINWYTAWDVTGQNGASVRGAAMAAIHQFAAEFPNVPISAIVQNPNQANNLLDNMPIFWKQVAALTGIGLMTDVYDRFIAAGKPLSWYVNGDPVHPSEPTGNQVYADVVWEHFLWAAASRGTTFPSLLRKGRNLLNNGGFKTWTNTTAAPDGWTSGGTVTFTKDTTVFADADFGYSVKMAGSGSGATYMNQDITDATRLGYAKGKDVSLAVRKRVGTAGNNTVGRFQLVITSAGAGTVTYSSVSYVTRQDDFAWWGIEGVPIPTDVTLIRVRLFQDSSVTPDASNAVWYDQACLTIGDQIAAARSP